MGAAVFLMGLMVFGSVGFYIAKDYILGLVEGASDDYESDGEMRTRIRHEEGL
jgi:hypothetical protein